jgi:hypothetical protein
MIINTYIANRNNRVILTPLGDRSDISVLADGSVPYIFKYENKMTLREGVPMNGSVLFYFDNTRVSILSPEIVSGQNGFGSVDISTDLEPGVYTFRIVVSDPRGATKALDYRKVLYNFPQLNFLNLTYLPDSDSYEITGIIDSYNPEGTIELFIPEHGNGSNGIKPITRIGDGAFKDNNYITRVSLSRNINSVGDMAFAFMPNLNTVSLLRTESIVQLDGNSSFDGNIVGRTIRVPSSLLSGYKNDPKWNEYASNIYEL